MSVGSAMQSKRDEEGEGDERADLDAIRGLVPAIVVGAAVWAIVFAIAVMVWG
jgi:hypothetical protein